MLICTCHSSKSKTPTLNARWLLSILKFRLKRRHVWPGGGRVGVCDGGTELMQAAGTAELAWLLTMTNDDDDSRLTMDAA